MPARSVLYPPAAFTSVPQANGADPQPPDPTTIPSPHTGIPPNWIHPSISVSHWPFANRYIHKLILEIFQ